jgi:DNA (cytosine-5)-methyltransferase 1
MIHFSLFSGIGGFDLAAEWMGWDNYLSCEIEDFPNQVLNHYWPEAYHHRDIKNLDYDTIQNELTRRFGEWRTKPVILTGGFPCQPYSHAGQRKGKEDERHLWPEMLRLIHEIKPQFIVGENVFGLLNWNGGMVFDEVLTDLASAGYDVTPLVIPAAAVNAPHGRDRIWFVANSDNFGSTTRCTEIQKENGEIPEWYDDSKFSNTNKRNATNTKSTRSERQCIKGQREVQSNRRNSRTIPTNFQEFPTQPPICGGDDGLPTQLDRITFPKWRAESIKGYGNAIVPQVAYEIFKAIELAYSEITK